MIEKKSISTAIEPEKAVLVGLITEKQNERASRWQKQQASLRSKVLPKSCPTPIPKPTSAREKLTK